MWIWVFNGEGGAFPGGVFSSRERAEEWIARHSLSGVLTAYPLDQGVFDWATSEGRFRPKGPVDARLIGNFSSAYQEHYHYENGRADSDLSDDSPADALDDTPARIPHDEP